MPAKIEEATTSKKVSSEAKELTPKLRVARGVIMPVPTLLHHAASNSSVRYGLLALSSACFD
jgi:hypothetical protein